jgi:P pilus assembly chaperone PapD
MHLNEPNDPSVQQVERGNSAMWQAARRLPAMPRRSLASRLAVGLAALLVWNAQSVAGVTPEASRVVFDEGAVEQSLQLFNVNKYPVLVQAWIDDGNILALPQNSKAPIIALPPIFRMGAGDQLSLRLINSGRALPADRESLFWLNLYEIPATPKRGAGNEQIVTVTMRTQIKVFVRPEKLPFPPEELPKRLTFSLVHREGKLVLEIENPTPYYATIAEVQLTIEGAQKQEPVEMVAPFSHAEMDFGSIPVKAGDHAKVIFSLLGDDGNPEVGERDFVVCSPK